MVRANSSYVITPDAFSVDPSLVGLPLARPSRRLMAMLLDLLIVAMLVRSGGAVLLGLTAGWFAFRVAGKLTGTAQRPIGRVVRLSVRAFGALILFLVATSLWSRGFGAVRGLLRNTVQASLVTSSTDTTKMGARQAIGIAALVSSFQSSENEEVARKRAGELVAGLRNSGMSETDIRETLRGITESGEGDERPWLREIAENSLAPQAPAAAASAPTPDSLARAYAAAVQAGDTAAAAALRPRVASALARDSLDALRGELREAENSRDQVAARLERVENRGFLRSLLHFLDELGIGFGWTGLYFTAFVALWKGQTPGKRLAGVRVVRLDGKPMTMWYSFERFGGYAAGLVTGLLGFAQVYWDRNRQMIHDKIVETVVVRERAGQASPIPAAPPAAYATPPIGSYHTRRAELMRS